MHRPLPPLIIALVTVGLLAGCSSSEPKLTPEQQVARGQQLFQARCVSCHTTGSDNLVGPGLGGVYKRSLISTGKPATDEDIVRWIKVGGKGMAGNLLPKAVDMEAMLAYLKTLP